LRRLSGGTYLLVHGPLAFELRPEFGTHLISIATAGQHMLFRALARELDDSPTRVVELVIRAFIRDRQTQPGSPLSGEAVGAFVAYLLAAAGPEIHGRSIHVRSLELVARGLGGTLVTRALLGTLGYSDRLASAPLDPPLHEVFAFIRRRNSRLSPATRALMALAEERLAKLARQAS
jgi:hypothetical protein